MKTLEIDQDISLAHCLPPEFYTDHEFFRLSKDKIFRRTWQFAGLRSEVNNVSPITLLEGFVDEPLLVTDSDGLRCFSNVCTHRGNLLVDKRCMLEGIRCGYHGRKFDLAGKFVSMPEFEGVRDFPATGDDLPAVELANWAGLLFVSIDPYKGFNDFFEALLEQWRGFDVEASAEVKTAVYEVNAHWALYCENYLEGFHIPYVHKSLSRELEYDSYRTSTFRFSSLQTAAASGPGGGGDRHKDFGEKAAFYFYVFPNLMFNFYPWGLSMNIVEPVTPSQTKVRYISIVTDTARRGEGAGSDLEKVEIEDQRVVESVQRGISSGLYKPGRYSVKREAGTHHFHRLIAEFMNREESK